ncbi:dicarbixylic amino acid permease [Epithele typhae]|uniref:dicarbixylic amino acid permease n=1 Tax=Epithele typhae TaxID=378194 RepID=UPI0020087AE5|nr:dicarbixylic amino acid permease [Epithele typhae]KAH9946204.1 dicarbixylic amino acid permease [Epithele typhae]
MADLEKRASGESSDFSNQDAYYAGLDPNTLVDPDEKHSLHRDLSARQISMIALGGAIGTGLIIGSGTALVRGGPLGIFLGYSFVGVVCYMVMVALGEMAAYLPHKKGFPGYGTRFVDPAFGFALGWNYVLKYLIVTPNNINAAGVVIQYWTQKVHIAIWMLVYLPELIGFSQVFFVNLLGVRVFGELEFWFSSIKVVTLIGLLLMGIIIDLGGNPKHDRLGFRYWDHPYGPMGSGQFLSTKVHDHHLAIFLGFWSTLTNALFAYIGTELIGVTVGEAQAPRKNIPIAIRRTFFRILVFYVGGVFVISLIVPSVDEDNTLFIASKSKAGAAASPFVVATTLAGIKVLNHIINAAILLFVLSAANSDLYIGTRTLYGLAVQGQAPKIFAKVNRTGVPIPALLLCTAFCALVFLNVSAGSSKVFGWFVNLVSTFGAITWMCICYTHIRFMKALKAQGMSRDDLPYKAPFQPWGSWFALISTAIITIFKGFDTFIPFTKDTFVTSYIALPTFALFYGGYKFYYRSVLIPSEKVDLITGKREIDEEEERFNREQEAKGPQTKWQKFFESL